MKHTNQSKFILDKNEKISESNTGTEKIHTCCWSLAKDSSSFWSWTLVSSDFNSCSVRLWFSLSKTSFSWKIYKKNSSSTNITMSINFTKQNIKKVNTYHSDLKVKCKSQIVKIQPPFIAHEYNAVSPVDGHNVFLCNAGITVNDSYYCH